MRETGYYGGGGGGLGRDGRGGGRGGHWKRLGPHWKRHRGRYGKGNGTGVVHQKAGIESTGGGRTEGKNSE